MPKIIADQTACEGYANCVVAADIAVCSDNEGTLVAPRRFLLESDRLGVVDAALRCRVSALRVEAT